MADPPGGISRELKALPPLKFVDCPHEAQVAFLDEVDQLNTLHPSELVGVCNYEPQVGVEETTVSLLTGSHRVLRSDPFTRREALLGCESLGASLTVFHGLGEIHLFFCGEQVEPCDAGEIKGDVVNRATYFPSGGHHGPTCPHLAWKGFRERYVLARPPAASSNLEATTHNPPGTITHSLAWPSVGSM